MSSTPDRPPLPWISPALAGLFLLAAGLTTATLLLWVERSEHRAEHVREELVSVADFKKANLELWVQFQTSFASLISSSPWWEGFERREDGLYAGPEAASFVRRMKRTWGVEDVFVIERGAVVWRDSDATQLPVDVARRLSAATVPRVAGLADLPGRGRTFLLAVPVAGSRVAVMTLPAGPVFQHWLRSWPGPTGSGETILGEIQGSEFVYVASRASGRLDPSRRVPVGGDTLLARAIRGDAATVEGSADGSPPGVSRRIDGTNWILLAQLDARERALLAADRPLALTVLLLLATLGAAIVLLVVSRRQERRTRNLEQRYRTLFEEAPVAIALSRGGRIIASNALLDAWLRLPMGARGLDSLDLIVPDDRERVAAAVCHLEVSGRSHVRCAALRSDGSSFPVAINATGIDLDDGPARVSFVVDLTEIERMEERLRQAADHYRSLIDRLPHPVWMSDPSGSVTYLNEAWGRFTGHPEEGDKGDGWLRSVHPEDRQRCMDRFKSAVRSRVPYEDEYRLRAADGSWRWMLDRGRPWTTAEGTFGGYIGAAVDIHDRRVAEDELRESETRFRSVVEGTSDLVVLFDASLRLVYANGAMRHSLGHEPRDLIRQEISALALVHEQDREKAGALFSGTERLATFRMMHCDGSWRSFEGVASRLDSGGWVAIARDITERRAMELALERSHRMNSLGRLAASVAHDFNNILMAILPFAQVIENRSSEGEIVAAARQIGNAVRRGREITREILRFTQPTPPELVPFVLEEWLREIEPALQALTPPPVHLTLAPGEGETWIRGDASQLYQAMSNLTLNAVQAMPHGGEIVIAAGVACTSAPAGRFPAAVISVRDSGTGISSDALAHVFEPLFTTKRNGTGLGLAITHQIVRAHGGEVSVHTIPGAGSEFKIFIPLAEPTTRAHDQAPRKNGERRAGTVLLVEDDAQVAAGLSALLELEGMSCRLVSEGLAAEAAVERERPGVVVLDVGLPDLEGTAVFEILRARFPSLPIIFSTGHLDRSRVERFLMEESVGYVSKPYEIEALLGEIARVTRAGRATADLALGRTG